MKTKTKLLIARSTMLGIVTVVALVVYAVPSTITPVAPVEPTVLTPTRQIDGDHSTGGTSAIRDESVPSLVSDTKDTSNTAQTTTPASKVSSPARSNAPRQSEIIQSVTTERTYRAFSQPNDPYSQNAGIFTRTNTPAAWDISTGGEVIVADIDTGFALDHEDLQAAWHINAGEQGTTTSDDTCWTGTAENKSSNSCDDDGNGYVDDWRGWSFVEIDNNPQAGRQNPTGDAVSHGTETAGLIGATTNNGIGIASHNWYTRLMPLQALSDDGVGYTSSVVAAIYYAVDNGAEIINLSLGSYDHDPYVDDAVQYAYDNNVVVVAAAGNCGTGEEHGCDPTKPGAIAYPALNAHVIAVGATTDSNQRASFSSYGPALDIMAPGNGNIISTMWLPSNETSAYSVSLYGTSFAAPIVSSLASLLRSERPDSSVDDIIALIDGTAQKISGLAGRTFNTAYGHGLIDSARAVTVAQSLQQTSATPLLTQTGSAQSEHSFGSSSLLTSGCSVTSSAYCVIWAQNPNGHDRYLPYQHSATTSSWQWYGSSLGNGEWRLRARSGDNITPETYFLFQK